MAGYVQTHLVCPTSNPTGLHLAGAPARAPEIAARAPEALLIDDDPYGDLRFASTGPPMTGRHSFASAPFEVLSPGRGSADGRADVALDACVRLKQATDLHTSTLNQRVALDLLRDREWLAEHLSFIRALYRERAYTLIDTLTARLGDRITIAPVRGGLFAWVRFVDGTDADELFTRAVVHGVAFVPGSSFSTDPFIATPPPVLCVLPPAPCRRGTASPPPAHLRLRPPTPKSPFWCNRLRRTSRIHNNGLVEGGYRYHQATASRDDTTSAAFGGIVRRMSATLPPISAVTSSPGERPLHLAEKHKKIARRCVRRTRRLLNALTRVPGRR